MNDSQFLALHKEISKLTDKILLLEHQLNQHEIDPNAHGGNLK